VLQLVNLPALLSVQEFLKSPSKTECLLHIPALYNLVQNSFALEDVLAISAWFAKRVHDILTSLQSGDMLDIDRNIVPRSWIEVSHIQNIYCDTILTLK
jgi:hypothetical protein